nr:archease [Legionella septentrionalis]
MSLIKYSQLFTINCKAPDAEILFIDWLNAIIFQMDARQMLFSEFQVHITPAMHLTAVIKGEKINRLKHQPAVDVKGATYNELHVVKKKKQWIAQCVVDV